MLLDFILNPIYLNYFDFVSILACLCVFKYYYSLPQKDLGLQLVLTLSISDFCFHSINLTNLFLTYDDFKITIALNFFIEVIVRFSTFWGAVMAYMTYKSFEALDRPESPKPPSSPKKLVHFILPTLICSIMYEFSFEITCFLTYFSIEFLRLKSQDGHKEETSTGS